MIDIFRIETDQTNLSWSEPPPSKDAGLIQPAGRLAISPSNHPDKKIKIWRPGLSSETADNVEVEVGPRLYEATAYSLLLASGDKRPVEIRHRDPALLQGLHSTVDGSIVHGTVNFRTQIGRSRFSVCVDGKTEYDFEVEVFPRRLDYAADYNVLLADVQEILAGLVLEYLKLTFQIGFATDSDRSSRLEWILLLRHVVNDLERGLRHLEQHPHHGLTRERVPTRVEKLRRPDATIAKMIRQGKGQGPKTRTASGLVLHSKLPENRARTTLDTPEHRWLASQLTRIRRILAEIHLAERKRTTPDDVRQLRILEGIEDLENRIATLQSIEPMAQAKGFPPPGFTSLTLQTRPGYREAYRACLILLQGLRVDGGPVELSVKDTSCLYEYWCYLALVRLVATITGEPIPVRDMFSVEKNGLRVRLKRGTTQTVKFSNGDRALELTYNPRFKDNAFLSPQPDVVLTFYHPQRPTMRLVIDAKYHFDPNTGYVKKFPGPPTAGLDVFHRYRDAILHQTGFQGARSDILKRTVMDGVALFPYTDLEDRFRNSRFWSSLEQEGIGAIPFLPRETRYLEEWLRTFLQRAGWPTAERSIRHLPLELVRAWQHAEKEHVLIATLERNAIEHLKWIKLNRCYYTPLTQAQTQSRQLSARWVAIYSPTSIRTREAITHLAEVESFELKKRHEIDTPWPPQRNPDEMQVVYQLRDVRELERPIENRGPQGVSKRFAKNQWTSRLAIMRATELREVLMETSAEWRLYEELRLAGAEFTLKPGPAKLQEENDPRGRTWFVKPRLQVQYRDAAGFLIRRPGLRDEYLSDLDDVVARFTSVRS